MAVYLGRHGTGENYKDRDTLARAYKRISSFIQSFNWKIKFVVFDGERAMGTDEFLMTVSDTGARPIPLPKGRKAHRVERKQGYVKAIARVDHVSNVPTVVIGPSLTAGSHMADKY